MAHYAFLDNNNIVTEVIVGKHEVETVKGLQKVATINGDDMETYYGKFRNQVCKRTSYNGNIRKNYAGIGYTYDEVRDAFIPPRPYLSWIFNEKTCSWDSPIPYPSNNKIRYAWDEKTLNWIDSQANELSAEYIIEK